MRNYLRSWLQDPQYVFPFAADEIVVDLFAGGGGASVGLEMALGRPVDAAVNHNPVALAMHEVNHPHTLHLHSDVWEVDPRLVARGRRVKVLWMSPDCTHYSRAKGGTPVSAQIRSLPWVALKWARLVAPEFIFVENVPEMRTWGPLIQATDTAGRPRTTHGGQPAMVPDPSRRGGTFSEWISALEDAGYRVEHRTLRACDYGVPTIRERLFVVARRDRARIVWPVPTHGPQDSPKVKAGRLLPYRTAADIIDWGVPAPSIFLTPEQARERGLHVRRPLAEATLRRIARGVARYVLHTADPLIIGETAPVSPHIAKHYGGVVGQDAREPLGTVTAIDHHSLAVSHLVKLYGTCRHGTPLSAPVPTITGGGTHIGEVRSRLVRAPFAIKFYREGGQWQDLREPAHTITTKARLGLITTDLAATALTEEQRLQAWWTARFMEAYAGRAPRPGLRPAVVLGAIPTERPCYLTVAGRYVLVDIGMRMLIPAELFRAQGFPDDYIHDRDADGRHISKTAQIAACGNSVPPAMVAALVHANMVSAAQKPAVAGL